MVVVVTVVVVVVVVVVAVVVVATLQKGNSKSAATAAQPGLSRRSNNVFVSVCSCAGLLPPLLLPYNFN